MRPFISVLKHKQHSPWTVHPLRLFPFLFGKQTSPTSTFSFFYFTSNWTSQILQKKNTRAEARRTMTFSPFILCRSTGCAVNCFIVSSLLFISLFPTNEEQFQHQVLTDDKHEPWSKLFAYTSHPNAETNRKNILRKKRIKNLVQNRNL